MDPQLIEFLTKHGTPTIISVALVACVGLVQWRKARQTELQLAFKRELTELGLTPDEVGRLLAAQASEQRGLIEQFGALSGGTQAGTLVAWTFVTLVAVSVVSGTISHVAFWSNVNQQRHYAPPMEQVPPPYRHLQPGVPR